MTKAFRSLIVSVLIFAPAWRTARSVSIDAVTLTQADQKMQARLTREGLSRADDVAATKHLRQHRIQG